jgi:hypothetical protein
MVTSGIATDLGGQVTFRRFTITYADLTDADTSQTINLFTLPKGGIILGVRIKHSTAFSGGTVATCTVSVGSAAGTATDFASAYDIFSAAGDTAFQVTSEFKAVTYVADTVTATVTTTVGNVTDTTAGSVDIDVCFLNVTTPL